jgi:hypothetical protein
LLFVETPSICLSSFQIILKLGKSLFGLATTIFYSTSNFTSELLKLLFDCCPSLRQAGFNLTSEPEKLLIDFRASLREPGRDPRVDKETEERDRACDQGGRCLYVSPVYFG